MRNTQKNIIFINYLTQIKKVQLKENPISDEIPYPIYCICDIQWIFTSCREEVLMCSEFLKYVEKNTLELSSNDSTGHLKCPISQLS